MKAGKVFLVGAGPGDPGLITQKGLDCLAKADVVVYDHLVDERLLGSAPAESEKIYVGKTAGCHTRSQEEISQLLITRAKEGKTVVRLKGGDPFVLGRGGEEAEVLAESSILYEVVPGVTSAVAVPAYAGIPVTHREIASSFAVITGHEDPDKGDSSINWEKLATSVDTLVFLMGMQNIHQITDKLIEHGRPATTPVAVIKDGTSAVQKTLVGTLGNIADKVAEQHYSPPAVIVVGDVVRLRERLRWFDNRPLFGKRILVTRARQQASRLSGLLSEHGARPFELPAIDIQPMADTAELDRALSDLSRYHWIIFTSVNGVEALFQRLAQQGRDTRALGDISIGAIGPATAESLRARGVIPDFLPRVYTTEGIIAGIKRLNISGQRFLLPRADIVDDTLSNALRQCGAEVDDIAAYRTLPAHQTIAKAREMLQSGQIDVITFTSSSTVANLMSALKGDTLATDDVRIASIGPKTSEAVIKAGLKVDIIAKEHTIPGLVAAIEAYYREEG